MKRITAILILSLIASAPLCTPLYGNEKEGVMEVELSVQGMTCDGCAARVREALQAVEGVISVKVELKEGEAEVHAKKGLDPQELVEAVEKAGFKAKVGEIEYESS